MKQPVQNQPRIKTPPSQGHTGETGKNIFLQLFMTAI
jgi:hypothetical protein